uniref:Uncharacterized protein n=1 Tax=Grapevine-associated levi-like virus 6 TaxID=2814361 RepID=A0A8F7KKA8_9VIRU|nr:MAG: hypothetical protein [Grapevine-associated levi-like virus 6]
MLIREILEQHSLPAERDVLTFEHRVKHEGDGFAAFTLPTLGTALEFGLEHGFFPASDWTSFRMSKSGTLPLFLGGLWGKVFNEKGKIRHDADPDAILGIRQICYWAKKPKEQCNPERTKYAFKMYARVEEELRLHEGICSREDPILRSICNLLWTNVFNDIEPERLICRHGPGATAERRGLNSRWDLRFLDVTRIARFSVGHPRNFEFLPLGETVERAPSWFEERTAREGDFSTQNHEDSSHHRY